MYSLRDVIDITFFEIVPLNPDQSVTSIGAGAKWEDVYAYLGSKNLTVCGNFYFSALRQRERMLLGYGILSYVSTRP